MTDRIPGTFTGPALLDLQVNGYAGFDFNAGLERWSAGEVGRVAKAMARRGVGAALPTLITAPLDRLVDTARRYAVIVAEDEELAGVFPRLHLEGPFISREDGPRGAHPVAHCRTPAESPDFLERLREASGDRIGLLTLAPELPGAMELIAAATSVGIRVALGHTAAARRVIEEAVAAGACLSTHLGNGSHAMLPRLDNYVQTQLADDRLVASFIADGHHLPWGTLKNFLRAKTLDRSILVTDAVAAADAPAGVYALGEQQLEVRSDGLVRIPGQSNLAGSSLTLDRAVLGVATHCAVPFADAWALASTAPARLLGLPPLPPVTVEVAPSGFHVLE